MLYQFRNLFPDSFNQILPLWNPREAKIIVYWEIPEEDRRGFVTVQGITLGACSAPLENIIQNSGSNSGKRILYAETSRGQAVIREIIRTSDWNAEMNPLVIRASTESPRVTHDFSQGCVIIRCDHFCFCDIHYSPILESARLLYSSLYGTFR